MLRCVFRINIKLEQTMEQKFITSIEIELHIPKEEEGGKFLPILAQLMIINNVETKEEDFDPKIIDFNKKMKDNKFNQLPNYWKPNERKIEPIERYKSIISIKKRALKAADKLEIVELYKRNSLSVDTIAQICDVGSSTVYSILKNYEEDGILKLIERDNLRDKSLEFSIL